MSDDVKSEPTETFGFARGMVVRGRFMPDVGEVLGVVTHVDFEASTVVVVNPDGSFIAKPTVAGHWEWQEDEL